MKLLFIVLLLPLFALGQGKKELISVRAGFSATMIVFNEATDPSFVYFGLTLDDSKTFIGNGPEFGLSKSINNNLYLDLGISTFSGKHDKLKAGENVNWYALKGYQVPLTINYLLRNHTKRLRFNLGGGIQYLNAHLTQYETVSDGGPSSTHTKAEFKISELQFSARPGIQYRIIPNLFAVFTLKLSISPNGRFSDNPSLFLTYNFKAK